MTFPYTEEDPIGEAEHRIIRHIFLQSKYYKNNETIAIISPDADVFLLGAILTNRLSTENKKITVNVLRKNDKAFNGERGFQYIFCDKFIDYIISLVKMQGKQAKRVFIDISFLMNIIGDDFLPCLKNFVIEKLPEMIEAYNSLPQNKYILQYDTKINIYSICYIQFQSLQKV